MKSNVAIVISFAFLVFGCVQPGQVKIGQCTTLPNVGPCNGDPFTPQVNVNLTGGIVAAPPNVCAKKGKTLKILLNPTPGATGTVSTLPKDAANTWLSRTNNPDPGTILIDIPASLGDGDYGYTIITSDGQCLDPMIHVN